MQQERVDEQQRDRGEDQHPHAAGRSPEAPAIIATTAIAIARSTDGSQRVMVPKHTSTTNRGDDPAPSPDRRSSGANSASTNATFSPETAMRCVSPAARNCVGERLRAPRACRRAGSRRAARGRPAADGSTRPAPTRATRWPDGRGARGRARRRRSRWRAPPPPRASTASARRSPPTRCTSPAAPSDSPAERIRRCAAMSPDGAHQHRVARRAPRPSNETTRTSTAACRSDPHRDRRRAWRPPSRRRGARIADASGETTSPCSARCITPAPSSATAMATTTVRNAGVRTKTASASTDADPCGQHHVRRRAGPAASPTEDPADQRDQHDDRCDRQRRRRGHVGSDGDERRELGEALVADAAHAAQVVDRREARHVVAARRRSTRA